MTMEIDARGLSCPAPVLLAKKAIETDAAAFLTVIVDNEASRQNVVRFLESRQFEVSVEKRGSEFHISATSGESDAESSVTRVKRKETDSLQKIMVMVSSNCIGHGDDELGSKLMLSFLKTIAEMGKELWLMAYLNNGVKLAVEGSETLPILQNLEKSGVKILVCGTCLSHFHLLDKKQVGETTNMLDIVSSMQLADKVMHI